MHDGASLNPTSISFSRTEQQHNLNKTVIECEPSWKTLVAHRAFTVCVPSSSAVSSAFHVRGTCILPADGGCQVSRNRKAESLPGPRAKISGEQKPSCGTLKPFASVPNTTTFAVHDFVSNLIAPFAVRCMNPRVEHSVLCEHTRQERCLRVRCCGLDK